MTIKDNNLKWTFYLQGTLAKIEGRYNLNQGIFYGERFISNIKSNVYKIILNTR